MTAIFSAGEAALIRSIAEDPGELSRRLVYADWLVERGEPRGLLLRVLIDWERCLPLGRWRAVDLVRRRLLAAGVAGRPAVCDSSAERGLELLPPESAALVRAAARLGLPLPPAAAVTDRETAREVACLFAEARLLSPANGWRLELDPRWLESGWRWYLALVTVGSSQPRGMPHQLAHSLLVASPEQVPLLQKHRIPGVQLVEAVFPTQHPGELVLWRIAEGGPCWWEICTRLALEVRWLGPGPADFLQRTLGDTPGGQLRFLAVPPCDDPASG